MKEMLWEEDECALGFGVEVHLINEIMILKNEGHWVV